MALTYYNARTLITQSPSNDWKDDLQEMIDFEFENSSDIYTIQEELTFGTQVYTDTEVRVNHAIDSTTGTKLGDDYRVFIFQNFDHAKGLGYRYQFNNNIWLCTNSDLYKYVTASTTVRRCNNALKWYDNTGVLRTEPCVVEYDYSGLSPLYDQSINIPSGNLVVVAQYNQNTAKIDINDRYILNGQAYKVYARDNFANLNTFDSTSQRLIKLFIQKDSIAQGDDLVNNIPQHNQSPIVPPTTLNGVVFSPMVTSILEGKTQVYTVYRYINNVQQSDAFSLVGNGVSTSNYILTQINGNSFSVRNVKKSTTPLTVTATSGVNTGSMNIILKGVF